VDGGDGRDGSVALELDTYPSVPDEFQSRRALRSSVRSAPLIGREAELAAILRLVADPSVRLVSLVGRGGVGKTRLALEVAWTLDASRPGSVHVISLASVPAAELIAAEIAAQLQMTMPAGLPAVDAVARLLRGAPAVLVLDNFEHLPGGGGVLTDLLDACEQLQRGGDQREAGRKCDRADQRADPAGAHRPREVDSGSGEMLGNFPQAFSHIGLVNAAWAITQAQQSTGRT
jgi:predicted ATPase